MTFSFSLRGFYFFLYQKFRSEHSNSFGHHPGDESEDYIGASIATTVVRKTVHPTNSPSPNLSDGKHRVKPLEQNHHHHKIPLIKPNIDQQIHQVSMKQPASKLHSDPFQNPYSGTQILLTSGDIEAMTMKQFRIGSLGC